ncbi:hypothetical protein BU24DRAFT_428245 [Aaosphaeria arxii CBS 175.79]|uniref:C2H2-type domain-containing protein n=1 Tax=Aaosphaeria arxii CBS 175.79 TaxID=1450172 RepID=A0A6A5XBL2_9PLEO|nr:uncharacterized protein BU24DRAFT_428245 [Aaosphaeria arxii CBS 175.79]KAF2010236.1 hypothetical protein BU24DRAFT_428245 [Aaosphaeria arxii CBS 175.79]
MAYHNRFSLLVDTDDVGESSNSNVQPASSSAGNQLGHCSSEQQSHQQRQQLPQVLAYGSDERKNTIPSSPSPHLPNPNAHPPNVPTPNIPSAYHPHPGASHPGASHPGASHPGASHPGASRPSGTYFFCGVCRIHFRTREGLLSHMKGNKGLHRHFCNLCSRVFGERALLQSHVKSTPNHQAHCNICLSAFKDNHALKCHFECQAKKMQDHSWICYQCLMGFEDEPRLQRHLEYGTAHVWCRTCEVRFPSQRERDEHWKDPATPHRHCLQLGCDFDAPNEIELEAHLDEVHFRCRGCKLVVDSNSKRSQHEQLCPTLKGLRCPVCLAVFGTAEEVETHQRAQGCSPPDAKGSASKAIKRTPAFPSDASDVGSDFGNPPGKTGGTTLYYQSQRVVTSERSLPGTAAMKMPEPVPGLSYTRTVPRNSQPLIDMHPAPKNVLSIRDVKRIRDRVASTDEVKAAQRQQIISPQQQPLPPPPPIPYASKPSFAPKTSIYTIHHPKTEEQGVQSGHHDPLPSPTSPTEQPNECPLCHATHATATQLIQHLEIPCCELLLSGPSLNILLAALGGWFHATTFMDARTHAQLRSQSIDVETLLSRVSEGIVKPFVCRANGCGKQFAELKGLVSHLEEERSCGWDVERLQLGKLMWELDTAYLRSLNEKKIGETDVKGKGKAREDSPLIFLD